MVKRLICILFLLPLTQLNPQNRFSIDSAISDFAENAITQFINRRIAVIASETDDRNLMIYFIDAMTMKLRENHSELEIYARDALGREAFQREQDFSLSGYVSDGTRQRIGQLVGVDTVVLGSIRRTENRDEHQMTIIAVVVETGRVIDRKNYTLRLDSKLRNLLGIKSIELQDDYYFWTIGGHIGTSFSEPWFIGTVNGTLAPFKYSFIQMGFDIGLISDANNIESYYSIYPFINYAAFLPFSNINIYTGLGIGYMFGERIFPEYIEFIRILAANLIIGLNLPNGIDISYTLRTNFISASNKFSVGYTYRFN
ncbi:MAG: CsgG/HfaB family protein [Treponema sp.]|nr:CsgG/HfaB family protein [Treponema sp.]